MPLDNRIKMEYLHSHLGNATCMSLPSHVGQIVIPPSFSAAYGRTIVNVARVALSYKSTDACEWKVGSEKSGLKVTEPLAFGDESRFDLHCLRADEVIE